MTKEEAERRSTLEGEHVGPEGPHISMEDARRPPALPAIDTDVIQSQEADGFSTSPRSPGVERTMRKAQKQVDKETSSELGRAGQEQEKPDRTIKAEDRSSALLPVVMEGGESSDSGGPERGDENWPLRTSSLTASSNFEDLPPPSSPPAAPSSGMRGGAIRQVSASTNATSQPESRSVDVDEEDEGYGTQQQELNEKSSLPRYDPPPRLDSDLIPRLTPLYASPNPLDPQKSVFDQDGEIMSRAENLPGIVLGDNGGGQRHTR